MLLIQNETSYQIDTNKIKKIAKKLSKNDIELIFVTNEQIKQINYEQRNINKPTDVLSFPYEKFPNTPLGSIVISVELALSMCEELGHSLEDEICLLFIHGFLHVSGYDHENDDGLMRKLELELVKNFNLPESLIQRTLK